MLIVAFRTLIMYAALLFALRLMGKSELSKMSPFQLVVVFMIAELAAIPIDSADASLVNGLIAIFTLMFLQILISFLSVKSEFFKNFITDKPSILIEKGKLNVKELSRQRIVMTDLLEQLRLKSCPSLSDVEYAIMESNGQLSVIKKEDEKSTLPAIIVSDGNLYEKNLLFSGIDLKTFEEKLRSVGITSFSSVFLAFCDEKKQFHIYLYEKSHGPFAKEVKL